MAPFTASVEAGCELRRGGGNARHHRAGRSARRTSRSDSALPAAESEASSARRNSPSHAPRQWMLTDTLLDKPPKSPSPSAVRATTKARQADVRETLLDFQRAGR